MSSNEPLPSGVQPYSKVRKSIIEHIGSLRPAKRERGRPAGLDKRIKTEVAEQLARIHPPDDSTWSDHIDVSKKVFDSIEQELDTIDRKQSRYDLLSPARRAVHIAHWIELEINNGGFDQYYLNSSGDGASHAPESLRRLGLNELAELVEKANAQFPGGPPLDRSERLRQLDELPESAQEVWNDLDQQFFALEFPLGSIHASAIDFVLKNRGEFFK